jgi:hypothetical protein
MRQDRAREAFPAKWALMNATNASIAAGPAKGFEGALNGRTRLLCCVECPARLHFFFADPPKGVIANADRGLLRGPR